MAVDGYLNFNTKINTSGFNTGTKQISNAVTGMKSMFGKLGVAISAAFAVRGLVNFGKQAIETASDIQEVQNVVDVSFGELTYQMEEFADKAIETYGISKLTAKQTGSTYMAMAKGMGIANQSASEMALTLTGLSADMASFYNKEQSVTSTALNSIFTGETETLKQFGIVMTEANLQSFAYTQGINKKISAMSQAEKVQLRYNYVLQQTALAQGDFVRTQDGWANQTRILSEQWKEFSGTVGTIFMNTLLPAVQELNKAMTWLNGVARSVLETLAAVFDWDIETNATGSIQGVGDAISGVVDEQTALNQATEEYKNQLMGFDKINKLSDDSATAGGSSSAGSVYSGSNTVPIDIDTSKADKKLTEFQQKLKDFVGSLKMTFNDVFFDWSDLSGEQICQKLISAIGTIAGSVVGFSIGGVPGAIVGALTGLGLSLIFSALTFDHDGNLNGEEIAKSILAILGVVAGGAIGFSLGGVPGAAIGITLGTIMSLSLIDMTFDDNGKLSADEIGNMICTALMGIAGGAIGFFAGGGVPGAIVGFAIGTTLSMFVNEIDWGTVLDDIKTSFSTLVDKIGKSFEEKKSDFQEKWKSLTSCVKEKTAKMKATVATEKENLKKSWEKRVKVIKDKTAKMKAIVATEKENLKKSWEKRVKVIKDKTANMKISFSQKVEDIKEAAKKRYTAVTDVFKGIPEWFRSTFSSAWDKVRAVFSSGGEVFNGIKDGILQGLKNVINALIDGINSVIAVPFNGINSALTKIKNISIAGSQPFYNKINTISVPQIPKLATGTVVPANYGEFLAILGDNKRETEVVSPLSTIKKAVSEVLSSFGREDINLNVYLDGKVIYKDVVKRNKQNTKITGVNALA